MFYAPCHRRKNLFALGNCCSSEKFYTSSSERFPYKKMKCTVSIYMAISAVVWQMLPKTEPRSPSVLTAMVGEPVQSNDGLTAVPVYWCCDIITQLEIICSWGQMIAPASRGNHLSLTAGNLFSVQLLLNTSGQLWLLSARHCFV